MEPAPLLRVTQVIDDAVGDLTCLKVDDSSACDSIHYQLSSSAQTSSLIRCLSPDCWLPRYNTVGLQEPCRTMNDQPVEGKTFTSGSKTIENCRAFLLLRKLIKIIEIAGI